MRSCAIIHPLHLELETALQVPYKLGYSLFSHCEHQDSSRPTRAVVSCKALDGEGTAEAD